MFTEQRVYNVVLKTPHNVCLQEVRFWNFNAIKTQSNIQV